MYNWRHSAKEDLDGKPMDKIRSWPEMVSFTMGFRAGYFTVELEATGKIRGFRPEDIRPRNWVWYQFPMECRRAKKLIESEILTTVEEFKEAGARHNSGLQPKVMMTIDHDH